MVNKKQGRLGLRAFGMLLVTLASGCEDENGPHCEGVDECVPYRATPDSCPEYRTIPLPSSCTHYVIPVGGHWVDQEGGCYSVRNNATMLQPGYAHAGRDHWCFSPPPEHCPRLPPPCRDFD